MKAAKKAVSIEIAEGLLNPATKAEILATTALSVDGLLDSISQITVADVQVRIKWNNWEESIYFKGQRVTYAY